jgi:hypothetical protein
MQNVTASGERHGVYEGAGGSYILTTCGPLRWSLARGDGWGSEAVQDADWWWRFVSGWVCGQWLFPGSRRAGQRLMRVEPQRADLAGCVQRHVHLESVRYWCLQLRRELALQQMSLNWWSSQICQSVVETTFPSRSPPNRAKRNTIPTSTPNILYSKLTSHDTRKVSLCKSPLRPPAAHA